jgi:hypothetical protein
MKYADVRGEIISAKNFVENILAGKSTMPVNSTGYKLSNNINGIKRIFVIRSMSECLASNFEKEPVLLNNWNDFEEMCIANNAEIHRPINKLPRINGDYLLTTDDMSLYKMTIKTE